MHVRLALLGLLLLASCGDDPAAPAKAPPAEKLADFGANPAPMEPDQAAVLFTPPPGPWRHSRASLSPGQYYEQFLSEDGETLLRLVIFPVQGARDPSAVLLPAADTFFRGMGVEGFGLPTRRPLRIWGAPAAEGSLNAAVEGRKVVGEVRLLLVDPETWALAIGFGSADAKPTVGDTIHRFITSLEPRDPQFYSPNFRAEADLDSVVAQPEGEEPIRMDQIAAMELLIEAGVGARFPLGTRKYVREALILDARRGPPETRSSFRSAAVALEKAEALDPEVRARDMKAHGPTVLAAILERAAEDYEPATKFAAIWKRLRGHALGPKDDGMTIGDLVCLNELSAFLASLAANRSIELDLKTSDPLRRALDARWAQLDSKEQAALREIGSTWAAFRRAWDLARPDARFAFRRAVMVRLAPEAERAAIEALADPRALMEGAHAREAKVADADLLREAFNLTAAERTQLIALLGVEPKPHQLGW